MEVWVEEVFAGVDTDADGEITLYDFELLEGREGSSSVRRLFEVVDCIDQDGSTRKRHVAAPTCVKSSR